MIEEIKSGMSHKLAGVENPVSAIMEEAVKVLYNKTIKNRIKTKGKAILPESSSRYIPASLKRAVFKRDNCCCQYIMRDGRKCGS
ncbi:MAG: hypothetical protein D6719_09275, partial [Candidatus Dadabacteria bacterium]